MPRPPQRKSVWFERSLSRKGEPGEGELGDGRSRAWTASAMARAMVAKAVRWVSLRAAQLKGRASGRRYR